MMLRKNIFSIIIALVILYLSLTSPEKFSKVALIHFRGMDKIVHLLMYFIFMSVILFENRKMLTKTRQFFIVAIIPLVFGALLELLQLWLTVARTGSVFDLLFNIAGILISVVMFLIFRWRLKKNVR
jgi:VanZ family protein